MCNALQLSPNEKMRTPDAIRKALGDGVLKWQYAGFVRSEGLRVDQEGKVSWGSEKWRGVVYKLFPITISGFYERSKETKNNILFNAYQDEPGKLGQAIVAVFQHFEEPVKVPRFGLVSAYDPRVEALSKKTRGPLIIPMNMTPIEAISALHLKAA